MQIAHDREAGGQLVRQAWISWAITQPNPKTSWLLPWEELSEPDKEADRVIWDAVAVIQEKQIRAILSDFLGYLTFVQDVVLCHYDGEHDAFEMTGLPWMRYVEAYLKARANEKGKDV